MSEDTLQSKLQALWLHVTNLIKREIVNPTLWLAMEAAHPLTLDGNLLILGIDGQEFHLATNLEQVMARIAIEKHLTAAARREIHYRIIQGDSADDWEDEKKRERAVQEMAAQAAKPSELQKQRAAGDLRPVETWEDLVVVAHRAYSSLSVKSIPQARAQYILDMMPRVLETELRLNAGGHGHPEDRGLGHALDKIGQLAETDPAVVALEYLHYKQNHSKEA